MDTISASQLSEGIPNPIFIYRERHSGFRAPHRHDFLEIGFVLDGTGTQITLLGEQEVQAGDVLIVTPSAWHGLSASDRLNIHFCCFAPSVIHKELAELMKIPQMQYLLHTGPRKHRGILSLHLALDEIQHCEKLMTAIIVASGGHCTDGNASLLSYPQPMIAYWRQVAHLTLLLTYLCEHCERDGRLISSPSSAIQEVVGQIEASPYHNWTLAELARLACLEPSYFIRRFRKEVGIPPLRYLFHVRMEWASELLVSTEKPINQIADEAGFIQPSYFSKRFREYFRTTPAQYRQMFQGITDFSK